MTRKWVEIDFPVWDFIDGELVETGKTWHYSGWRWVDDAWPDVIE